MAVRDNGREEGRLKRNGTDAGPERLLEEVHDAAGEGKDSANIGNS